MLPGVDVDLRLVASDRPGTVRAPDLIVVNCASYERTCTDGGLLPADDVVLAVEILSPSSRRTDSTIKHDEYSDAGIPHYWIVDIDGRTTLTACHLAGEFGYVDAPPSRAPSPPLIPSPSHWISTSWSDQR